MPQDRVDMNDSPINAEPEELATLRRELAEVESKIERIVDFERINHTRLYKRALFVLGIKRTAILAQISAWTESNNNELIY